MSNRRFYRVFRWPEPDDSEFHPKAWMFECDHLGNVNLAVLGSEAATAWDFCQRMPHIGRLDEIGGLTNLGMVDVTIYDVQPGR